MFNWFKKRQYTLIPNDINDGMMTNTLLDKGLKLDTKITIPTDIVCFISYKDKIYKSLEAGTYTLDEKVLGDLIYRQYKKRKCKKVKMDLFFVNKKRFTIDTTYIDKMPVGHKSQRLHFNIKTDISVNDAKKFADYLLSDTATITAEESIILFRDYVEIFSRKFFLKVSLDENLLSNEIKGNLQIKLEQYLNKFGVTLHNFDISISDSKEGKQTSFFSFNHIDNNDNKEQQKNIETLDQEDKKEYTENNSNYCPNCNMKLIQGTRYCHRCGYEL